MSRRAFGHAEYNLGSARRTSVRQYTSQTNAPTAGWEGKDGTQSEALVLERWEAVAAASGERGDVTESQRTKLLDTDEGRHVVAPVRTVSRLACVLRGASGAGEATPCQARGCVLWVVRRWTLPAAGVVAAPFEFFALLLPFPWHVVRRRQSTEPARRTKMRSM